MLSLSLKGSDLNRNAIGAKLLVYKKDSIQTFEKMPTRGFQSSMETPLYATIGNIQDIDSMLLIWQDNTFQKLDKNTFNYQKINELTYVKGLPKFNFARFAAAKNTAPKPLVDITARVKLDFIHVENPCIDFDAEPLIPHATSTEGPALAVGDLNGDGLEDVFVGGAKWQQAALFFQAANGTFTKVKNRTIALDSICEDTDALIIDVDNDHDNDLIVGSGGNEFKLKDDAQQSRVYLNDGKGNFTRLADAFAGVQAMVSTITAQDFTGDGVIDLFVGGRTMPHDYGATPNSYLLQNDGKGHFKDVTAQWNKDLATIGMVKHSNWADLDGDKDLDLIVATEWDVIYGFFKENNGFRKEKLTDKKGWWNFTLPCDVDNDGDLDLIAGNLGENTRLQASDNQPVKLFFFDADDNGKKEQIVTHFVQNKEVPFMTLPDIQRQIPSLKKKYLFAKDFAKADLKDIFAKGKLEKAQQYEANYFSNAVLINDGKGKFTTNALPGMAQLSPYHTAQQIDANGDNLPDILLYGNFYNNSVQLGRYDADYGKVLINKGNGQFSAENATGVIMKGEVRRSATISLGKKKEKAVILARNNKSSFSAIVKCKNN
jgi:enediyne biosynthesis protein E4